MREVMARNWRQMREAVVVARQCGVWWLAQLK